ncbi:MAG: hypothetical protein V4454_08125 [Pseudomonadota bacterium]
MSMPFAFSLGLLIVFIAIGLGGSYLLRAILPETHPLQQRLTHEANLKRVHHILKNFKAMLGLLLVVYLVVVTL